MRVDACGKPRQVTLSPGNTHDTQRARELIDDVDAGAIIADKAYDADWILDLIGEQFMLAVVPPTKSRKVARDYDKELYKERNAVERFFARIKNYRGIATRYEKTASSFLAMLHFACVKSCLL